MTEQVSALETAILQRAEQLAAEYRERAQRSHDNILREAHERLQLREEREVLQAKARAERAYRRKVQANELKFNAEMDHLRWSLVEGVLAQLTDKMQALADDQAAYLPVLSALLAAAAGGMREQRLVAEVNSRDLARLQPIWGQFSKAAADKQISLSPTPIETLGGILVRTEENRVRLDNTFEGRKERLASQLHLIILQRLLPDGQTQDTAGDKP